MIEADDDSEIGDDVVLYQHAHRTGDYNTAHAHADHNEQRDELKIDDTIVAAFAWIPDLQVVVAIGAITANWATLRNMDAQVSDASTQIEKVCVSYC
eukprot:SAG22_NODE_12189_length_453_cov_0.875706_1_plen_97_part_00